MEPHAAVLALALLSLAGSQATTAGEGATQPLPQLEGAINVIEEVAQVTRRTGQWLQALELGQKLQSQARDLSDQMELEVSPKLRQALKQAINSAMRLVDLALWAMEPYLEAAVEQAEALGLDLPGVLQASAQWAPELKEQLVGLLPSCP